MRKDNLIIENARIIFRNFAGAGDKFNREGNRNFAVVIDDGATADALVQDGWNVKSLKPRDEYEEPTYYLPITINMSGQTKICMVTRKNITQLDEESMDCLDFAEIESADVTIRPYDWEVNGKTGRKAYLKTLYITIVEDDFADKYHRVADDGRPIEAFNYRG